MTVTNMEINDITSIQYIHDDFHVFVITAKQDIIIKEIAITYQYGVTIAIHNSINNTLVSVTIFFIVFVICELSNKLTNPTAVIDTPATNAKICKFGCAVQFIMQGIINIDNNTYIDGSKCLRMSSFSLKRLCVALNDCGMPNNIIATALYIANKNIAFDKQSIIISIC